jgi:uncharacterized membrane protein
MTDMSAIPPQERTFPVSVGVFFGLGLGGFFDGIVLHQVLQWHHMLSSWYPVHSMETLEWNTLWDGIFHGSTSVFVLIGLYILWRAAHRSHLYWSNRLMIGTLLLGWGIFNFVEGIVNHQMLGVHHVNELAPQAQRIYWDMVFLLWGLVMIAAGLWLMKQGTHETRSIRRRAFL